MLAALNPEVQTCVCASSSSRASGTEALRPPNIVCIHGLMGRESEDHRPTPAATGCNCTQSPCVHFSTTINKAVATIGVTPDPDKNTQRATRSKVTNVCFPEGPTHQHFLPGVGIYGPIYPPAHPCRQRTNMQKIPSSVWRATTRKEAILKTHFSDCWQATMHSWSHCLPCFFGDPHHLDPL